MPFSILEMPKNIHQVSVKHSYHRKQRVFHVLFSIPSVSSFFPLTLLSPLVFYPLVCYTLFTGPRQGHKIFRRYMMELTKNSHKLICILYRDYLEKCNSGVSVSKAKSFGSSHNIHERLCPNWLFEDVDETCRTIKLFFC